MQDFAAIDFETANYSRSSICSIGVTIFRNGTASKDFYTLVKPDPLDFLTNFVMIHGIHPEDVENAPIFPEAWARLEPLIQGMPLIAHNAAFEKSCLKAAFSQYRMQQPNYLFICTMREAKQSLPELRKHTLDNLCRHFNIPLKHHNAASDARACGELALKLKLLY